MDLEGTSFLCSPHVTNASIFRDNKMNIVCAGQFVHLTVKTENLIKLYSVNS